MKFILTFCLLFCLILNHVNSNRVNCPDTDEPVWVLAGSSCFVYRNRCYLNELNRYARIPPLESTKEECKRLCQHSCSSQNSPETRTYKGQPRVFRNICERMKHECLTGETFI